MKIEEHLTSVVLFGILVCRQEKGMKGEDAEATGLTNPSAGRRIKNSATVTQVNVCCAIG